VVLELTFVSAPAANPDTNVNSTTLATVGTLGGLCQPVLAQIEPLAQKARLPQECFVCLDSLEPCYRDIQIATLGAPVISS